MKPFQPQQLPLLLLLLALTGGRTVVLGSRFYTCTPGSSPSGVSLPRGDIYMLQGTEKELYCHLNPAHDYYANQGMRGDDLYFWTPDGILDAVVLNTTSIRTTFVATEAGVTDVQCQVRNGTRSVGICNQRIFAGRLPQNLVNFVCRSENWHNLNCTWDEPENPVPTDYDLSFMEPGNYAHPRKCPASLDNRISSVDHILEKTCYLDLKTHPPYRQPVSTYKFYVNATNPLLPRGKIYSFVLDHYSVVQPGQAVRARVNTLASDELVLQYSVPSELIEFEPGLVQDIRYRDEWSAKWKMIDTSHLPLHQDNFIINVPHLKYPYTEYTFKIRMRSSTADPDRSDLWSDEVVVSNRTLASLPARSPSLDVGSFEAVEVDGSRSVLVYWKRMDPHEYNGPEFRYTVRDGNGEFRHVSANASYVRFDNSTLFESKVRVFAENAVGPAQDVTGIVIPQAEFLVGLHPKSLTKIWKGLNRYEIAWRHPERADEVSSYTLFWCRSHNQKDRPYQCNGEVDWTTLPKSADSVQTHDLRLPTDGVYQIAVSANTKSLSSGMTWSTCTVIEDRLVSRVSRIEVLNPSSTTVWIHWKLDCSDQAGIVYGYRIEYCTDAGCKLLDVSPDHDKYEILGLSPYTYYTIGVRIENKDGYGELGRNVRVRTLPDRPGSPPTQLTVNAIRSSTADLSWRPPVVPNGVISEYRVELAHYNTEDELVSSGPPILTNMTSLELQNLLSYTRYVVNVTACTRLTDGSSGCSRHAANNGFLTKTGPPAKPPPLEVQFENATLVRIAWTDQFQIGAPEAFRWEVKVRRSGPAWDSTRPYSRTVAGNRTNTRVLLDHVNDIKDWSPDCENDTNTNMFEFAVRVIVRDVNGVQYIGDWSEPVSAAAYCSHSPAWLLIVVICVVVSVSAVMLTIGCCWLYNYWYDTNKLFGEISKEMDRKFVLASADNVDSPGPEFEMNQLDGEYYKGNRDDKDDDDADTLLLDGSTPEQKSSRQKSSSESATSDVTSGCESQGGRSLTTDCSTRFNQIPVPTDLASTCSGYVSMCRVDTGGSAASGITAAAAGNYTQVTVRPNSSPYSFPPVVNPADSSSGPPAGSAAQLRSSTGSLPCSQPSSGGTMSSSAYLARPSLPQHTFGTRLTGNPVSTDVLGPMLEETSLSESGNLGYSFVTGVSAPTTFQPVPSAVSPPPQACQILAPDDPSATPSSSRTEEAAGEADATAATPASDSAVVAESAVNSNVSPPLPAVNRHTDPHPSEIPELYRPSPSAVTTSGVPAFEEVRRTGLSIDQPEPVMPHILSGVRNANGYISVQQAQELVLQPNPNSQQYCRVVPRMESGKPISAGSPGNQNGNYISPSFV